MPVRKARTLPAEMDAEQRALYEKIALGGRAVESAFPLVDEQGALAGPFDAMLLSPALGDALQALGAALRFRGTLTDRAREFAILLVGHERHSTFEVQAHEAVGRRIGLGDEDFDALSRSTAPASANDYESAVVDLVLCLVRDGSLDDDAYAASVAVLGEPAVFEVNLLVGYYSLLATQLNVFAR